MAVTARLPRPARLGYNAGHADLRPPPATVTVLRLHGPPQLMPPDGAAPVVLSTREAALLAWLHVEGPTPRARLAGLLWPEGSEAQARANLRQTLRRLRQAAGPVLDEDGGRLRLAAQVRVAADDGAPLLGPIEIDDAQELSQWLEAQRDAARRARQREGLADARARLAAADLAGALRAADAVLADDPAAEEAHRVRMEVMYLRGDRAAAVAAWDECRDALRRSLGLAPSAATRELGELILSRDPPPTRASHAGGLPAALRRPPHLIGRDDVRERLQRALALGHHVVVTGVGGIGKSRLLGELAAGGPMSVNVGARPGDSLLPGALLDRLLDAIEARVGPQVDALTRADVQRLRPLAAAGSGAALQSALDQQQLFRALVRWLAAARAAGLRWLVLDDLHFADALSIVALQRVLADWLAAAPGDGAQVLLGARSGTEAGDSAPLVELLTHSGRAVRAELAPLASADVMRLLDDLPLPAVAAADKPALAEALASRVGGNPAFLLESLRNLWLDGFAQWRPGEPLPVPDTLREAVRQRLCQLPEEALQVAQLAAVATRDFTPAIAASALGRKPLQLAPVLAVLEAAQVFDGQGFAHDLLAEAVQRSLPSALRAPLHRLVAEHLMAHGGAAASIAHHLQAAGDERAAAPWQLRAAEAAAAQWQMARAAEAYEAAALGFAGHDDAQAFTAWLGAARCALWARRHEEAERPLAAAEPLAADALQQARLAVLRVACDFSARRVGEAVRGATSLTGTLSALAPRLDAATLADGLRVIGNCVPWGAPAEPALALAEQLSGRSGKAPEVDVSARRILGAAHAGLLQWAGQPREAAHRLEPAWAGTRPGRDAGARLMLGNQRMRLQHALGDLEGAIATGVQLLDEAEPLAPGTIFIADVMHVVAMLEIAAGRAADALARFDRLHERLATAGEPAHALFITSQALACLAVGRIDEARAWLARHPPAGGAGLALQDLALHLTQARCARFADLDARPWLRLAGDADALPPGLALQRDVATASLQQPRADDAARLATLVETLAARGMRGLQRVAAVAAARAALAAGRPDLAQAQVGAALALDGVVDAWVDDRASVWLAGAQVLQACGQGDAARRVAAHGAAWVREQAAQWQAAADRDAWLEGQPHHRGLLAWPT